MQHLRDLKQETFSVDGILVFMRSLNFSWVEHEKSFITLGLYAEGSTNLLPYQ